MPVNDGIGMGAALWGRVCQRTTYRNRESTSYKQFQEEADRALQQQGQRCAKAAAEGALTTRRTLRPAILPASLVALRWASEK